MHSVLRRIRRILVPFLAALIALASPAGSETLVGTNVDSRMMIGFSVSPGQVQKQLPEGWAPIAFPTGPLAGANLLVGLEERLYAADAEGKPTALPTSRAVALMALARQTDGKEVRLYVLRLYTSAPGYDPFMNAVAAQVTRKSSAEGVGNAGRMHEEAWTVTLANKEALHLDASFATGRGSWASGTARPYSNTDPTVSRVFTYDQLVELVTSEAAKIPLKGELKVTTTIPELTGFFDGSQKLVGMMNIPVYVRKVYTP